MSMNELYAYCQHFHDNWSNPNIFACTSNTLTKPVDVMAYKTFSTVGNTQYLIILNLHILGCIRTDFLLSSLQFGNKMSLIRRLLLSLHIKCRVLHGTLYTVEHKIKSIL